MVRCNIEETLEYSQTNLRKDRMALLGIDAKCSYLPIYASKEAAAAEWNILYTWPKRRWRGIDLPLCIEL